MGTDALIFELVVWCIVQVIYKNCKCNVTKYKINIRIYKYDTIDKSFCEMTVSFKSQRVRNIKYKSLYLVGRSEPSRL